MTPFDHHQAETARALGYGDDVAAMNRDHDPLHRRLCAMLGVVSHSMRDAAGERLTPAERGLANLEEAAVMMTQRFMRAHVVAEAGKRATDGGEGCFGHLGRPRTFLPCMGRLRAFSGIGEIGDEHARCHQGRRPGRHAQSWSRWLLPGCRRAQLLPGYGGGVPGSGEGR